MAYDETTGSSHPDEVIPVLVLGGWSPGPLLYLRDFLLSQSVTTLYVRKLPMPPIPAFSWCFHAKTMFMIGLIITLMWLLKDLFSGVQLTVLSIAAILIWFRLFAAVVVRVAINTSIQIALKTLREYEGRKVVVIGFSWGGAVSTVILTNK